ncbi:hypothetical protein [Dyella tabacisoli]|uniref:Uncharacterized protein n=1 Tax=Dyella tabacisoli TaxID=2282381 RepID=A0A369UKE8_9GAMM|nr:hypothetical protein [Dyella tabacisoli]RDD81234.1 hypothetical protein DVJ77_13005 [Dyella tabacisoli]
MTTTPHSLLILAALLSAIASMLHIRIMFGGAAWYDRFGAGQRIVDLAKAGHWYPTAITSVIAIVLAIWAAYALSGAGVLPRLPLLRTVLCVVTSIYLLRGLVIVPLLLFARERVNAFALWSSLLCLFYGAVHGLGLIQVWPALG